MAEEDEPAEAAEQAGKADGSTNSGCLVLVVLAVVVVLISWLTRSEDSSELAGPDETSAIDVCHHRVEDHLRAPSTAEFSGENATPLSSKSYTVTGNVDAENGFGAMLRSRWTCTARWVEDEQWNVRATLLS